MRYLSVVVSFSQTVIRNDLASTVFVLFLSSVIISIIITIIIIIIITLLATQCSIGVMMKSVPCTANASRRQTVTAKYIVTNGESAPSCQEQNLTSSCSTPYPSRVIIVFLILVYCPSLLISLQDQYNRLTAAGR